MLSRFHELREAQIRSRRAPVAARLPRDHQHHQREHRDGRRRRARPRVRSDCRVDGARPGAGGLVEEGL